MAVLLEPDDYLDIGLGKIVTGYMFENLNLFCTKQKMKICCTDLIESTGHVFIIMN
jgi:hypothetical protein